MHFGFTLDSSDIDLLNIDLLDIHLDLSDTYIPSKQFVSRTSWRRLRDMSSRRLQDMSSRRLQDVFKTSSRCLEDVLEEKKIVTLKTCWMRLQDMSSRRLEDVLKTNKCLLGSDGFRLEETLWTKENVSTSQKIRFH